MHIHPAGEGEFTLLVMPELGWQSDFESCKGHYFTSFGHNPIR